MTRAVRPPPRGQSVMEVLVAMALFVVLAGGLLQLVIDPLVSTANASLRTQALFLASQGLEAARSIATRRWTDLALGTHGVTRDGSGNWVLAGSSDLTDGVFTRTISVYPVERDGAGDLVTAGGTIDPRSKKVVSSVKWTAGVLPIPREVTIPLILTDWNVYDWLQTTDADFGAGLAFSDTQVLGTGTGASVTLEPAVKEWIPRNNTPILHTTDQDWLGATGSATTVHDTQTEFNAGTYANTQYDAGNAWVELTAAGQSAGTGTYVSSIAAASSTSVWSPLAWVSQRPTFKQLPASGTAETGYAEGNVDMNGDVMLLRLNEDAGATVFTDNSGQSNSGSCAGGACPTSGGAGKLKNAATFDGTTDVITVNDAASLDLTTAVTVEAWMQSSAGGTALGDVSNAVVDSLEFDTANGLEPSVVFVSGDVYAVAYRGPGNDGFVRTFTVDAAGAISNAVIDSLEFDVADGFEPDIFAVAGNVYGVAYRGPAGDGFVKTFTIDGAGNISNAVVDSLEFDTTDGIRPRVARVAGTTYVVAYTGPAGDGFVKTFTIDGAGNISNAVVDSLEFDTTDGLEPSVVFVSGDVYAVAYRGPGNDGFVRTFTVDAAGAISNAVIDSLEFDVADGFEPDIFAVAGNVYGVAYRGPAGDGFVKTFTIDGAGNISNAVVDSLEFDTADAAAPDVVQIGADVFAVAYTGPSADGFVKSMTIDAAGNISNATIDTLEFDTADGAAPKIRRVSDDLTVVVYGGPASVGFAKTLRVSTPIHRGVYKPDAYGISAISSTVYAFIGGSYITGTLAAGWNHVVMTYDSAASAPQHRLYINGTQVASQTLTMAIPTNNLAVQVGRYLNGSLDEVAVYNRALNPTDVSDRWKRAVVRLKFQVRSCDDALCAGESFIGPDGTAATSYTELDNASLGPPTFALTNLPSNPYFQYRATFETDSPSLTPELKTVTFARQLISGVVFNGTQVVGVGVPSSVTQIATVQWANAVSAQGQSIFHTTDADFNPGTFSNTVVTGSAAAASVGLGYVLDWRSFASPTTNELRDSQVLSSTDGFAVGAAGTILRWNGTAWNPMTSPTTDGLWDISMVNANDGWAVGDGGRIIRWNGTSWSIFSSPTGNTLFEVHMISSTDGWAAGINVLLHWNGVSWSTVAHPGFFPVYLDVYCLASNDCWAVGLFGIIHRWNGTSWSAFASPTGQGLYDISTVTPNNGFISGANGTILSWNGTAWSVMSTPTTNLLYGVTKLSDNSAFAVGDAGTIIRWDGVSWSTDVSNTTEGLRDVQSVSTTEAWVVGDNGTILHYGQHYHLSGTFQSTILDGGGDADWGTAAWDETLPPGTDLTIATRSGNTSVPDGSWSSWSAELTTPTGSTITSPTARYLQYRITLTSTSAYATALLNDIFIRYNEPPFTTWRDLVFANSTDGWMVGDAGAIARWNGTSWIAVASPTAQDLNSVDCAAANDCWAVAAAGQIIRWNGTAWSNFVDTGTQIFRGIKVLSVSEAWAVANSGQVWRWNGSLWTQNVDLGTHVFRGVDCSSSADCWAVADSGRIARWNGTSWSQFIDTGSEQWNDIHMLSATDGWIVANGGSIRRWNGAAWNVVASGTAQNLIDVHCASAGDCWAVGSAGTIIHWNDSAWNVSASPTGSVLEGVRMISAGDGFAIGASGTIIRYTQTFAASATYESQIVDGGSPTTTWDLLTWVFSQPFGTNVVVSTRSGPTPSPSGGGWSAYSAALTNRGGSLITSPANRYFQYRVSFTSSTLISTAALEEVQIIINASTKKNLFGVEGTGIGDVWAVGRDGVIVHYDGALWSPMTSPVTTDLLSIDTVSSSLAFAVGANGKIIKWNGSVWAAEPSPVLDDLYSVSMVSPMFGAAVGYNGVILHWNGSAWSSATTTGTARLRGVSMISASDGFAVGDGGTIKRWNGSAWSSVVSPTLQQLNGVHCLSSSSCWAVGENGVILRWNGTVWSSFASPVSTALNAVEARTASSAWAVGAFGKILEFDGSSWTAFATAVTLDLYDLTVYNPTDGWIAGQHGMLLKDPTVYSPFGQFFSSILDTDSTTSTFMVAFWNATTPALTNLTIAFRSGNVPTPDGTWSAFTSEMSVATGTPLTVPPGRYMQYRASLATTDTSVTPSLNDITVTYR